MLQIIATVVSVLVAATVVVTFVVLRRTNRDLGTVSARWIAQHRADTP
jgi:hypothetical protein